MPTFTSGNDTYTVSSAGTYNLDFLGGDDRLNAYADATVTAHMGLGNDLAILKAGTVSVFGDAGADRFDIYVSNAIVDGGADRDTINFRGGADQSAYGGIGNDRFNFYADGVGVSLFGDDGNDDFFGYNHQVSGTISGGLGSDYFNGFITGVTLAGGGGNDIYRVTVSGPATFLENPGEGTDAVQVARGYTFVLPDNIENISIQGFSGSTTSNATITGNTLGNRIAAHNNAETIYGLDGNDNIASKGGIDALFGGNGNDYLDGGTGNDQIYGDAGNDTLQGRSGDDVMEGGAGDDTYYVDSASDQVHESFNSGIDTVRISITSFALLTDAENVIVQSGVGDASVYGNGLNNTLSGGSGNDYLFGGAGGDDVLKGGAGNDHLYGDNGNDTLYGGAGDDFLDGHDEFDAGNDNDLMYGGTGNDTYVVNNPADDLIFENSGEGTDTVQSYAGDYTLAANVENAAISFSFGATLHGNGLNNVLSGNSGNDILWGEGGNDTINGGDGFDQFSGGDGNDTINGGGGVDLMAGNAGVDTLSGGDGNDVFYIFAATESAAGAADSITDFYSVSGEGSDDQIDLASIDANTSVAGDQAFTALSASASAHGLWFTATANVDSIDYVIYGDVNGDTIADIEFHVHALTGNIFNDDITL